MSSRKGIFFLLISMLIVALLVSTISIRLLYFEALKEERVHLAENAQSQARLMESIGRFDEIYSQEFPGGPVEAIISQIRDSQEYYGVFGETGEMTLAKREEDLIVFVLRQRHFDTDLPRPIPFDSTLAEPMRRALSLESGTMIGLDYRGETVIAAYEPIAGLGLGVVVKMDLVEVQSPFIRSGIVAVIATMLLMIFCAFIFFRINDSLLDNIFENEEKFRRFMEAATDGFFLFDEELNYVVINDVGMGFFPPGTMQEDILGKNILDIAPRFKDAGRYEQYKKVMETGKAFFADDIVVDPKVGDVFITIRAFKVGEGLGVAITDVTKRKKADEANRLLEVHLRQKQKIESIGTLASGVAHEINNPITGIMNYAQLIHDRIDPKEEKLREFSIGIIQETERVAEIVGNLLNFSRKEGKAHSPAQMVEIVNSSVSLVQAIFRKEQIYLELDLPDGLPELKCRRQQIQQVIMNLLTNARDSLNVRYPGYDADKVIKLSIHPFEKDGRQWLRTTVEDHGIGLSSEIRERIFDPFFTTKDRTQGTGLGLSISLGIVQEHQGELTFESIENRYTRFYLDLPIENGGGID